MEFSHITPVPHLEDFAVNRPFHLTLAHLVARDARYREFYRVQKAKNPQSVNIMDNSLFEIYKHNINGGRYYSVEELIELGGEVSADYIVITDYPDKVPKDPRGVEYFSDNIEKYNYRPLYRSVQEQTLIDAQKLRLAGFGTFYVPQSKINDAPGLIDNFLWALEQPLIDYIAFSILSVPNAYRCEKDNKLQRYLSRSYFLKQLDLATGGKLNDIKHANNKKFHFLGMVDGPNEIDLVQDTGIEIDTWDSSAAVWLGLNAWDADKDFFRKFDKSPTGLKDGKFEKEVDFNYYEPDSKAHDAVRANIAFIDSKL